MWISKFKTSLYITKKVKDNYNFVSKLTKILSNELIDNNVKKYPEDYEAKSILKLIEEIDFNNNLL